MNQAKDSLLEWVKAMQTEDCHNKGIYYLKVEGLPADFSNKTVRSGLFHYMVVIQGSAELMIDHSRCVLQTKDMLFIAPRMTIGLKKKTKDFMALCVCLEPAFFDSLFTSPYAYKQLYVSEYASPVIPLQDDDYVNVQRSMKLFSCYLLTTHTPEMIDCLANFFLLQIAEIVRNKNVSLLKQVDRSDEIFRLFSRLLAVHYRKEHNIAFYAEKLHVSQPYLSRTIRKVSGNTVKFHISKVLLIESRRQLIFKDSNIKEIAEELGFADQSSFGKFFKKETGMSPFDFRQGKSWSDV